MKRILLLGLTLMFTLCLMAQEQYFQAWRYEEGDRFCGEGEPEGILVLSKHDDLLFNVTNITDKKRVKVNPLGIGLDGNYQYVINVERETPDKPNGELKIEANRQGDIHSASFTVKPRPQLLLAFMVAEPEMAIVVEDQTAQTDFAKSYDIAIIEIKSSIPNLKVDFSSKLKAQRTTSESDADKTITINTITIPIKVLTDARGKAKELKSQYEALNQRLTNVGIGETSNASDAEWNKLDALQKQSEQAENDLDEMSVIYVYADKTNICPIDISQIAAHQKKVYGVRPRKETTETFFNECSGFMNEGDNAFKLRQYDQARQSFVEALNAKDAQPHQKQAANERIANCDKCKEQEEMAMKAFGKIRQLKQTGGSQEDVVNYAKAGIRYLETVNGINPQQFYVDRIEQLTQLINDQPLQIGITFAKLAGTDDGLYEAGILPNVEVWAFYGTEAPVPNDYKNDKKFNELTGSSNQYRQMGRSDNSGQISLQFERTNLPKGFLFRPVGYGDKIKIEYRDFDNIMKNAEGSYNKRRFRVKMYSAM